MHGQCPAYVFIDAHVDAHFFFYVADLYIQECVAVHMRVLCAGAGENVHWKQSGGGEGNMTARLACSAGDPTHHLPPGAPSMKKKKTIESFYSASPSSGLWIGSCPKTVQV